jgi:mono/diheme cytochrome c family protein
MTCGRRLTAGLVAVLAGTLPGLRAAEPTPAERGEKALLTRSFTPGTIGVQAYRDVWRLWGNGVTEPPADYDRAFRERYGMHEAPYPNGGLPMGLREAPGLLGTFLSNDCMICHGGSIAGKSYVGLGNATFDYQSLSEDFAAAQGRSRKLPFRFCNVRGTIEAGAFTVFLLGLRNPDLTLRTGRLDLGVRDDLCEDTPAWWLLRKKKTIYYTGSGDARSVRTLMQFLLSPLNPPWVFDREEKTFGDIQAYLLSLRPPKYPFPVNHDLARKGEGVFKENCSRCHGTYGEHWTYPNKIVPLAEIGTDPTRYRGISDAFLDLYNKSWFGHEHRGWLADEYIGRKTAGYQAPPLDGIWATAPYLHNGSVPTVYHVLNSKARPKVFTRSYRTDADAYDPDRLGWKVRVLDRAPGADVPGIERRKVYDTTQPGRGNGGHTFGDDLTEDERRAVIEYLKTL